jgi:SAM-dependent methyltransferase
MLRFDDEGSRRLVAAYLTPDVVAQRRSVRGWLELRPGERVLDVGVGPGFLAAEMAGEVGADGLVAGIDVLPLLNVGFDPVRAFSAGLIDIIGDFVAERDVLPAAEVDAWKADLRSLGDGYFFGVNRYVFRAIRA